MSDQPKPPAPPSRRQAARLAAVQALYQWQEGQDEPADIVEQFLNVRTGEAGEGGMRRDADKPLFKDVVEGTAATRTSSRRRCRRRWPRTGPGAASTGWCARSCWPAPTSCCIVATCRPEVAINEYVEIAHAFYDQGEPSFMNSVLDRVARQARVRRTRR